MTVAANISCVLTNLRPIAATLEMHAGWLPMNALEARQGGRMLVVEGQYSCADVIKAQEAFPASGN